MHMPAMQVDFSVHSMPSSHGSPSESGSAHGSVTGSTHSRFCSAPVTVVRAHVQSVHTQGEKSAASAHSLLAAAHG